MTHLKLQKLQKGDSLVGIDVQQMCRSSGSTI